MTIFRLNHKRTTNQTRRQLPEPENVPTTEPAFWKPAYWDRNTTMDVQTQYCGPMDQECQYCGAKFFQQERPTDGKFTVCCHKGQLELPPLDEFPERLKELVTGMNV